MKKGKNTAKMLLLLVPSSPKHDHLRMPLVPVIETYRRRQENVTFLFPNAEAERVFLQVSRVKTAL